MNLAGQQLKITLHQILSINVDCADPRIGPSELF